MATMAVVTEPLKPALVPAGSVGALGTSACRLTWRGCGWGQEALLFPWVSLGHTPAWGPCVWKTLGALSPSLFQLCVLQS